MVLDIVCVGCRRTNYRIIKLIELITYPEPGAIQYTDRDLSYWGDGTSSEEKYT